MKSQILSQDRVNLMIATMPISVASLINDIQDLAYRPDARTKADELIDSYPLYEKPKPMAQKSLHGHYRNPLMPDIIDYLINDARIITIVEIESIFGVTSENVRNPHSNAAELLYKMEALGMLRSLKYKSSKIYTLRDRQLTIADIPDGVRNDRIMNLHNRGLENVDIAKELNISYHIVKRIVKSWPNKRTELLAPPTN